MIKRQQVQPGRPWALEAAWRAGQATTTAPRRSQKHDVGLTKKGDDDDVDVRR